VESLALPSVCAMDARVAIVSMHPGLGRMVHLWSKGAMSLVQVGASHFAPDSAGAHWGAAAVRSLAKLAAKNIGRGELASNPPLEDQSWSLAQVHVLSRMHSARRSSFQGVRRTAGSIPTNATPPPSSDGGALASFGVAVLQGCRKG
jgi:hypothetical protein